MRQTLEQASDQQWLWLSAGCFRQEVASGFGFWSGLLRGWGVEK